MSSRPDLGACRSLRARVIFGAMSAFLDAALVYDPPTRRADLALGADGDLLLDETPVTPMLISLGTDRRAEPDDELPSGIDALNAPSSFVARRGWAGDALDPLGRKIGCRLWLLDRAKQTETTRRFCAFWAEEALAWSQEEIGRPAEVSAEWLRKGLLALRCMIDGSTVERRIQVS
ncbi:phage GP46 family protein [Bosea sp. TND4EK4]|uniref:phage GP46 family protein n=1 Tax=Bosea sp. TND4EK4 TaxID=1907408 RepID=UPI0009541555|nr:phage GP46 family protein [Bosea sp. TND4EK4]SIP96377.1 Phage protein GP46 [Bosea sp. TND4EK4]